MQLVRPLTRRIVFQFLFVLFFLTQMAGAGTIIVPGTAASTEGNQNSSFPFNIGDFGVVSQRYQQVYSGSSFFDGAITRIAFRPDAVTGSAFFMAISNIQISLSTTAAGPDTLSTIFADNIGPDNRVVFSGSLPLSSGFAGPAGGPKSFDISINLIAPFPFFPSRGNLLLDVRNFSGETTIPFDAQATFGDAVSRVFSTDASALVGSADTLGLVTNFTEIPEPTGFSLSTLGAAFLLILRGPPQLRVKPKQWFCKRNL